MYTNELARKLNALLNSKNFKTAFLSLWQEVNGYKPNLDFPQTYNEKLLWKYFNFDQNKILNYVDKIAFKKELVKMNLKQYIVPSLFSTYSIAKFAKLDLAKFKFPYIIKFNNSTESEDLFIVKNNKNLCQLKQHILVLFKEKYQSFKAKKAPNFSSTWCYIKIKPGIIIEPLLSKTNKLAKDYKIFAFNSKKNTILIQDYEKVFQYHKVNWDNFQTNISEISQIKDKKIIKMNEIANFILQKMKLQDLRIDFYYFAKKIFIGEFTFLTANSFFSFYKQNNWYNLDLDWGRRIL